MRISDWSSDVCSSDLRVERGADMVGKTAEQGHRAGLSWIRKCLARALTQLEAREKTCVNGRRAGREEATGAAAPPRYFSSDVIFELVLRQVEDDEQLETGALHRGAHFGKAQRIDRRALITRLALAGNALTNVGG